MDKICPINSLFRLKFIIETGSLSAFLCVSRKVTFKCWIKTGKISVNSGGELRQLMRSSFPYRIPRSLFPPYLWLLPDPMLYSAIRGKVSNQKPPAFVDCEKIGIRNDLCLLLYVSYVLFKDFKTKASLSSAAFIAMLPGGIGDNSEEAYGTSKITLRTMSSRNQISRGSYENIPVCSIRFFSW